MAILQDARYSFALNSLPPTVRLRFFISQRNLWPIMQTPPATHCIQQLLRLQINFGIIAIMGGGTVLIIWIKLTSCPFSLVTCDWYHLLPLKDCHTFTLQSRPVRIKQIPYWLEMDKTPPPPMLMDCWWQGLKLDRATKEEPRVRTNHNYNSFIIWSTILTLLNIYHLVRVAVYCAVLI